MLDAQTEAAQLPPNANDGSLSGAVAAMQNIDIDSLMSFDEAAARNDGLPVPAPADKAQPPRAADGKFQAKEAAEALKALPPNHNQKPDEAEAIAATADASDVADEFFEMPPDEEGGEPVRIPAKEVFDGYQEAKHLRQELEQAKRVAPPPVEWDRQMYETVQTRGQLVQLLETVASTMMPPEPDANLINPGSPLYDPGAYHQQQIGYNAARARLQQVIQMRDAHAQQADKERGALREAARIREQGKLIELWPEIRNPQTQRRMVEDAARFYGITQQDIASTYDARLFAVLRDALAYRDAQSQRQTAVKVVRGAPKLVKSPARDTQGRGRQAYATGMRRLQQSGSVEDAANAIGGLLG